MSAIWITLQESRIGLINSPWMQVLTAAEQERKDFDTKLEKSRPQVSWATQIHK